MKLLTIILVAMGCTVATAKPHHPKHMPPHAHECHECDGHGTIRTWKKAWLGMRLCKKCDGRGYIIPKPLPPPPPKAHNKKPVPPKAHDKKHHPAPKHTPQPSKNHRKR